MGSRGFFFYVLLVLKLRNLETERVEFGLFFFMFFYVLVFFFFWLGHDLGRELGPNLARLNGARRAQWGWVWAPKKTCLVNGSGPGCWSWPAGQVRVWKNPARTRSIAIPNHYFTHS